MTDADHDAVRQLGSQRAVQCELLTFVQRRGRLVEEYRPSVWRAGRGRTRCAAVRRARGSSPSRPPRRAGCPGVRATRCRAQTGSGRRKTCPLRPDMRSPRADRPAARTEAGTGTWSRPAARRSVPDVNGQSCARLRNRVVLPVPELPVITNESPESSRMSSGSTSRAPSGVRTSTSSSRVSRCRWAVPSKSVAPLPLHWR